MSLQKMLIRQTAAAAGRRRQPRRNSRLKPRFEPLEARAMLSGASSAEAAPAGSIALDYANFLASGRGDKTTVGDIAEGSNQLQVASTATWKEGHGVRVRRAGADALLHNADSNWTAVPGVPAGVVVAHDAADKIEGAASVHVVLSGAAPDSIELAQVDLGGPANMQFDELRFWIKSESAISEGDLSIDVVSDSTGKRLPTFQMELPSLDAGAWTEVFVGVQQRPLRMTSEIAQFLTLRCKANCSDLDIRLDDFQLVQDLVGQVEAIQRRPGGVKVLELRNHEGQTVNAGRSVTQETVYHDDTLAVVNWLKSADPGGANLYAPRGVYFINSRQAPNFANTKGLPLYNDTHLVGAGADKAIFKKTPGSRTGGVAFRSFDPGPENITIENVGFDWNGWNAKDFGDTINIQPRTATDQTRNIHIRNNRFFDSNLPGLEGCDLGQGACATRQRHHLLVRRVDGLWVEDNDMSGGGRIKAGGLGLGRNMYIRNNVLDFVNDNGITIVQQQVDSLTEHVEITGNTIINPVTSGIFFGADGEKNQDIPGMTVRDVTIAHNRITGSFAHGIQGTLPQTTEDIRVLENVVVSQRERPLQSGQFVVGIVLRAGSSATNPATDIRVEGNTIVASGEHGVFNVAGMRLGGPMEDITVAHNEIRNDGSERVERGIRISDGAIQNLDLHHNRIVGATTALQLGFRTNQSTQTAITDAHIHDNEFLDSTSSSVGQITVLMSPDESVQARIERNQIARGAGDGIVTFGEGLVEILISQNTIFANAGLGIDLDGDGVTANDSLDADSGPNQLQNFPKITSIVSDQAGTTVQGVINTNPTSDVTIEFFANASCDPSGHGEGEIFVGSIVVPGVSSATAPDGATSFTAMLDPLPVGHYLTATATNSDGNTSEFSACVQIPAAAPLTAETATISSSNDATAADESESAAPAAMLAKDLQDSVALHLLDGDVHDDEDWVDQVARMTESEGESPGLVDEALLDEVLAVLRPDLARGG